jgi:hypothetical protein
MVSVTTRTTTVGVIGTTEIVAVTVVRTNNSIIVLLVNVLTPLYKRDVLVDVALPHTLVTVSAMMTTTTVDATGIMVTAVMTVGRISNLIIAMLANVLILIRSVVVLVAHRIMLVMVSVTTATIIVAVTGTRETAVVILGRINNSTIANCANALIQMRLILLWMSALACVVHRHISETVSATTLIIIADVIGTKVTVVRQRGVVNQHNLITARVASVLTLQLQPRQLVDEFHSQITLYIDGYDMFIQNTPEFACAKQNLFTFCSYNATWSREHN